MERVTTIADMREFVSKARSGGGTVGFVPTMGALHDGHIALARRARAENTVVVVSVFVNPTQFNDTRDLDAYPRVLERDLALCEAAGADAVFAPDASEMYPVGFSSQVLVGGTITGLLEGAFRPGHFAGVTTVVNKLFNIVGPDRAYFGEKDWQQLKVIEKMTADLAMPVQIVPCETVREADGLAMSSRNARLTPEARKTARVLPYLLDTAQDLLDSASIEMQTNQGPVLRHWLQTLLASNAPDAQADYIVVVEPDTLYDVEEIKDRALVALAIHIGGVRLIDNRIIVKR